MFCNKKIKGKQIWVNVKQKYQIEIRKQRRTEQNKISLPVNTIRRPEIDAQPADLVHSAAFDFASRRGTSLYSAKSALTTADEAASDIRKTEQSPRP